MERLHRLRLRRFDALIAVSEATRRVMRARWGAGDVTVIHHGIERPARRKSTPGDRFLSLGRLAPEKALHVTLRAFREILHRMPDATLTVAGTGPLEAELRELAASLGIAGRVRFAGFVSGDVLSSHDVLIQPSLAENLSYSLLDAAAHGLGVAATRVGGNPEFLPEHCLVDSADETAIALVAVDQALHPQRRSELPGSIPSPQAMTEAISWLYCACEGTG